MKLNVKKLRTIALEARTHIITIASNAGSAHIASCLSVVDILTILYFRFLHIPSLRSSVRDRFILSKGHAGLALYVTLFQKGWIPRKELYAYGQDGTKLAVHPVYASAPGIEASTGSLGHGLSIAVGLALGAARSGQMWRAVALLSDGEMDEGSTWEAILLAGHLKLRNLIAIVDYNKIQSFGTTKEVLDLEPMCAKWEAAGWTCYETDGHDFDDLGRALEKTAKSPGPSVIIAHTVKGKGVPFMENTLEWHYLNVKPDDLESVLAQIY